MQAETVYLFRHALMRDAAYQLQLPGSRARLHGLALDIMEDLAGRKPLVPQVPEGGFALLRHQARSLAVEMLVHAHALAQHRGSSQDLGRELAYMVEAALYCDRAGDVPKSAELWNGVQRHHSAPADLRIEATLEHAWELQRLGKAQMALTQYNAALEGFQRNGNANGQFRARGYLSSLLSEMNEMEQARKLFEANFQTPIFANNMRARASLLSNYGNHLRATHRAKEAEHFLREAVALHQQNGNTLQEWSDMNNLATVLRDLGRDTEAEALYRASADASAAGGNRRSQAIALSNLASLLQSQGRADEALALFALALPLHEESGNIRSFAIALGNYGTLLCDLGKVDAAIQPLRRAISLHQEVSNVRSLGFALAWLSIAYAKKNEWSLARQLLSDALAAHAKAGNARAAGLQLADFIALELLQGDIAQAREHWRAAESLLRACPDENALKAGWKIVCEACTRAGLPPLGEVAGPR